MSSSRIRQAARMIVCAMALGSVGALPRTLTAQNDTSVRVSSNAVVDISLRGGRLLVRGVDGNSGTVRGDHRSYELRTTGTTMSVQPRESSDRSSERQSSSRDSDLLEVDVPRGARLVVRSLSGDVEVRDMSGSVDVRTASGTLRFEGVSGRLNVESMTGDISVTGRTAGLRATTVSGDLRLREMRGELEVHTTSGDVSISGEQITRLTVESISGNVGMDGLLDREARVRITAHSGNVTLRLPDEAHGMMEVSTFNGTINTATPLTMLPGDVNRSRAGRNSRRYQLGNGGPMQLEISTFNGNIRLVRTPQR
ncbi:MAG: DUF4097 family beta strand repeat protein [Gemmatimonadaceae bacterium]|nr:DUF4097 family beta strand repeat protein [Gemmatimonadaceae bacterium]